MLMNKKPKSIDYTTHVKTLSRLAKLADVSTVLIRKLQKAFVSNEHCFSEIEKISAILKLPKYVELPLGSRGYFSRADALAESIGDVVWSVELELWITRRK